MIIYLGGKMLVNKTMEFGQKYGSEILEKVYGAVKQNANDGAKKE